MYIIQRRIVQTYGGEGEEAGNCKITWAKEQVWRGIVINREGAWDDNRKSHGVGTDLNNFLRNMDRHGSEKHTWGQFENQDLCPVPVRQSLRIKIPAVP